MIRHTTLKFWTLPEQMFDVNIVRSFETLFRRLYDSADFEDPLTFSEKPLWSMLIYHMRLSFSICCPSTFGSVGGIGKREPNGNSLSWSQCCSFYALRTVPYTWKMCVRGDVCVQVAIWLEIDPMGDLGHQSYTSRLWEWAISETASDTQRKVMTTTDVKNALNSRIVATRFIHSINTYTISHDGKLWWCCLIEYTANIFFRDIVTKEMLFNSQEMFKMWAYMSVCCECVTHTAHTHTHWLSSV